MLLFGLLGVFLIVAILISMDKLPAVLAIPFMALLFALIGGVPAEDILTNIIAQGTTRLASALIAVIFGAWLGQVMLKTGIAESIIRKAAELGGDKPFPIGVTLVIASAILFTSIRGLGAVIMIGTIVLPIMTSIGIPSAVAACLLLMGISIGNLFNLGTWGFFTNISTVELTDIYPFVVILAGLTAIAILAFFIIEFKRADIKLFWNANVEVASKTTKQTPLISLFTPFVPLIFVLGFKWPIEAALIMGILYAIITTIPGRTIGESINTLTGSLYESFPDVAPAISLMIGIGILLNAVAHPNLNAAISGAMEKVMPTSKFAFILFFGLMAPLALYRGPFNLWGLGSGIVGIMVATDLIPPVAIMAAFLSISQVQYVCDPTNTHNVWSANFTKTNVTQILLKTLPYMWIVAMLGTIIGSMMYLN